jgi:hypothetical protein
MVAELVRIFDVFVTDEAKALIDGITERTLPLISGGGGKNGY